MRRWCWRDPTDPTDPTDLWWPTSPAHPPATPSRGPHRRLTPGTGNDIMLNESEIYIAPASFGQRRLWLNDCLDPGRPTYNVPVALRVSGRLRPELLRAALAALTGRHETLRTAFGVEDGEPVQLISAALEPVFAVVELGGLPAGRREAEARRGLALEAERPFDLTRPPLLRTTLLTLGPDDHRLLLSLHHIVTDGWSLGILVRELLALYAAGAEGRPAGLPELPIQYAH